VIELHEPRPEWAAHALAFARLFRATLGARARRIHHIGSTAVPGLAAKNIVDMQVTLPDLGEDRAVTMGTAPPNPVAAALDALGLSHRDWVTQDHFPPGETNPARWAKRLYTMEKPRHLNLHLRVEGAPNAIYALLFRDYLRATPAAAAAYEQAKRRLASECGDDRAQYAERKDPVCDRIVDEARRWAEEVGWKVPPTEA
jgi:GrpB-like predicted nucleotidyltransferase (UPF0157 family)